MAADGDRQSTRSGGARQVTSAVRELSFLTNAALSHRGEPFALVAQAFSFPDPPFYGAVADGRWCAELDAALERLPRRLRTGDLAWPAPADYDEMQSEYIRLFQVGGRRGPPCSLHEGHYTRDRSQTLQHLIRFYNFFGYRVTECVMPDYLPVQLEFVSELAAGRAGDEASCLRAQRDFLQSHLAWTEELARRVVRARPHQFYRSLSLLASRLVAADLRLLASASGGYDGRS